MQIKKQLRKNQDVTHSKIQENFIKQEVTNLLEASYAEEKSVMRNVGLTIHLDDVNKKQRRILNTKEYENKFGEGKVFHIDEIEKLGMDYRLFFDKASNYRGPIVHDLGVQLMEFNRTHNMGLESVNQDSSYFVLAPPKMFVGYKSTTTKLTEAVSSIKNSANDFLASFQDPAIFYRLPGQGENYVLIASWGKDLSVFRRILGFFTKTPFWLRFFSLILLIKTWHVAVNPFYRIDAIFGTHLHAFMHQGPPKKEKLSLAGDITMLLILLSMLALSALIIVLIIEDEEDYGFKAFSTKEKWRRFRRDRY